MIMRAEREDIMIRRKMIPAAKIQTQKPIFEERKKIYGEII